ncbi:MAG: UrcA family protein [Sandarakinorhabdus sp.]|nr:UrcA family protein [Sandarakinorhabdus sp.]
MATVSQRRLAAGIFGVLLISSSSAVLASPASTTTRISVATYDIDVASVAGVEKLNQRVNSAIRSACAPVEFGGASAYGTGEQVKAQAECLAGAHATAASQVQKRVAAGNPKVALN